MKRIASLVVVAVIGILTASPPLRADTVAQETNFIEKAYLDLLHRPASPTDVTFGLAALGSETRYQFALTLDTSTPYYQLLVNSYFQNLLGRAPMPSESISFTGLLGSETDEAVQAQIVSLPEFFADNGSSNSGFVTALYTHFLGRSPTSGELAFFVGELTTLSRQDVAAMILGLNGYETDLVTSYYQEFLHRPPDSTGLTLYVNGLHGGTLTDEQVIATLIGSDEYLNLAQPPATPEPGSVVLGCLGVAGLWLLKKQLS